MKPEEQEMPCPVCQCAHARGPYKDGPDGACAPGPIACPCGATLKHVVPFFASGPYGWKWVPVLSPSVSSKEVDAYSLDIMRARGGAWAAYECCALDSSYRGQFQYLKYGPNCTHQEPPPHAPDSAHNGAGWKWLFVGLVDLETGKISPVALPKRETSP